jgi:hypothetical protein
MKSGRALGHNTSEWIQNSIRRIDTIQVFGDFGAEKAPRDRMFRVALDSCSAPIFYGYQHTTGIGAVVGTGGMHNILHDQGLYISIE